MANEIVKAVAKKIKVPEAIAQIAVDTVVTMLKAKLPPAVGKTLDLALGATATSSSKNNPLGDIGNIAGALGGMLGKK